MVDQPRRGGPHAALWPWLLANGCAFVVGRLAIIGLLIRIAAGRPPDVERSLLGALLGTLLSGIILGAAQRAALRPALPLIGWVVATATGVAVAQVLLLALAVGLSLRAGGTGIAFAPGLGTAAFGGACYGLLTATGQWAVARRRGLGAGPWLAAGAAGWAGGAALMVLVGGAIPGAGTAGDVRSLVIGPALNGLVYGLATWLALARPPCEGKAG